MHGLQNVKPSEVYVSDTNACRLHIDIPNNLLRVNIVMFPDGVIGIFHSHNPSDRTMVLGSTQPLIQMSTRRISWG